MTDGITASESESAAPANEQGGAVEANAVRRPIGLVLPTLVLIAYWIVTESSHQLEMGMFYRFVTRIAATFLTFLFFLVWGLTRRHFSFGQRLLAFVVVVGSLIVAGALGHPKTGTFATALMGLPILLSLSVLWLWATRQMSARVELTGISVASILVFGVISQLRCDGMDGRQRPELSWRWMPSPEELFLKEASANVSRKPPVPVVDQRLPLVETADDWSSFRGGSRESVVRGVTLGDWSKSPPKESWRRRVGPAWSSVIVIGDHLFTQEKRGDQEAVVCYQLKTGDEVWSHAAKEFPDKFNDSLSGAGPRATPTFHENRLYTYGAKGQFNCLNAATGELYWSHALFALTGATVPMWGAASSPTIVDDKVVAFTGGTEGNSVLAFDRLSGEKGWQAPGGKVSYSSPQVMTIAGVRQIVIHDEDGIRGLQVEDGKPMWSHSSPHKESFQPMLQLHQIADDRLLINWDAGLLCLTVRPVKSGWQVEEQWTSNKLKPSFNDFVIHADHIYGLDDGIFCCLDLANGQRAWKRGRYGFGQMLLLADINEILVITEKGDVVRVAADPKEHREIGSFKAIEGKTWNHPLLARGRLVVRNAEEMACFEVEQMGMSGTSF